MKGALSPNLERDASRHLGLCEEVGLTNIRSSVWAPADSVNTRTMRYRKAASMEIRIRIGR